MNTYIVEKKVLREALRGSAHSLVRRPPFPILQAIALSFDVEGVLVAEGADVERSSQHFLTHNSHDLGTLVVPVRWLRAVSSGAGSVIIEHDDTNGKASVGGEATGTLQYRDFPTPHMDDAVTQDILHIPAEEFRRAAQAIGPFAALDYPFDHPDRLTAVRVVDEGANIRWEATDGRKAAWTKLRDYTQARISFSEVLLPADDLSAFVKAMPTRATDVLIQRLDNGRVVLKCHDLCWAVRRVDPAGHAPNIQACVPGALDQTNFLRVKNPAEMAETLTDFRFNPEDPKWAIIHNSIGYCTLALDGRLRVLNGDHELAEGLNISFHPANLLRVLETTMEKGSEYWCLRCHADPLRVTTASGNGVTCLLMPVRLHENASTPKKKKETRK